MTLIFICLFRYFSNFKNDNSVWDQNSIFYVSDYVTLANDEKENLQNSFTICSSIFVKVWVTRTTVIEMLKQDGSHWFNLELSTTSRNYKILSEYMEVWFYNPVTGNHEKDLFRDTLIPIIPHSWYHICMGLDTVSGLLRIVINGKLIVDQEKEYFKNTTAWKPRSVNGKIILFKAYVGFWYQQRATFSNMNIFNYLMSKEKMVLRTSGGDGCDSPGDYLRYIC